MFEIVTEIARRTAAGETVVLCVVVRTRGSCPQSAGAAMLVLGDGTSIGTLGGGCVEAEMKTRALRALHDEPNAYRTARLSTFRLDQDYGWDDGLVCGGVMDVAFTILTAADAVTWDALTRRVNTREPATFTLRHSDEAGATRDYKQVILPPPRLLIAGAGHVGQAVAGIADVAGFGVSVIDDRSDVLKIERFPRAALIHGDIAQALASAPADASTFVVIVTRGHNHDAAALDAVVRCNMAYLGLIGSKTKIRAIFRQLYSAGVTRDQLRRVHAPVGIDLNAVTPGEIAVSIVAQLIAARRGANNADMRVSDAQLDQWLDAPR